MFGSVIEGFEDLPVYGHHFLVVNELGVVCCGGIWDSPTTSVYGRAEYEDKVAPYKMGRRSGRKAEATKKEVPVMNAADAKCIYGTNGEYGGIGGLHTTLVGIGGGVLLGGPHLCTVEHPFPHLQSRYFADVLFGPFRVGDGGGDQAVNREAEGSEEPERGGGNPGQDRETEWVCCAVNELLGEGLDRFGHVVVNMTSARWEIEQVVRYLGEKS